MQQDVVAPNRGKDIRLRAVFEPRRHGRCEGRVLEVGTIEPVELHQAAGAERRLDGDHLFGVDLEVLGEDVAHELRSALLDRTAHHVAEAPPPHAFLDAFQQVVGLQLLDCHLGVAGDAKGVGAEQR